jgi:hypothetical protein
VSVEPVGHARETTPREHSTECGNRGDEVDGIAKSKFDAKLGLTYVEVNDEPNHVESFKNDYVRVYMATIAAGSKTLYHRHSENTLYVTIEGGIQHIDLPGSQKERSVGLQRSLKTCTKIAWAIRRLVVGTINLPTSTILMQYHRNFPIIHCVCASATNAQPMKLLGIEVFPRVIQRNGIPLDTSGLELDYSDEEISVYRIRLDAGNALGRRAITGPSLLVMISGHGRLKWGVGVASSFALGAGNVRWLGASEELNLANAGLDKLAALLVVIN